jgi:HSP20 family protein
MKEWTVFDEIKRIQNEMDKMFFGFFENEDYFSKDQPLLETTSQNLPDKHLLPATTFRTPLIKTKETNKSYVVDVEIPGANKEDIQLNVVNNGIEIKVEKKQEKKEKETHTKQEMSFYRYFSLPENSDINKVDANYKNGVLSIEVPKKTTVQKKITVK